jgi:hypothetical protein
LKTIPKWNCTGIKKRGEVVLGDSRLNGFLIVGFAAWFAGTVTAIYANISIFSAPSVAEILAAVFFVFVLCTLFFGRFSSFGMFFAGLISGPLLKDNVILGLASLIAFLIAGLIGSLSGFRLFDDFHGNDNFYSKENLKQLGLYLTIALILAVLPALLQDFIPKIGVQELPGLVQNFIGV